MLKIRFRDFPEDIARNWLIELVEIASSSQVTVVHDSDVNTKIDLEIVGPYGGNSDAYTTPFLRRLSRFGFIKFTRGHHLSKRSLASGNQPLKSAKRSIWFTGENTRPPYGEWDATLTFDSKLDPSTSAYLPLWMLSSTNLLKSNSSTLWNQVPPSIASLLQPRNFNNSDRNFCCSFINKAYPMRLHAVEVLSEIKNVDIFGTSARNFIEFPGEIAKKYKFCLCFENDIYPGYVTEKPFEAYIAGTIPLYYGYDIEGYLNPKAVINLMDFDNIISWSRYVHKVNNDIDLYEYHFRQPILNREPSLDDAVQLIRKILHTQIS